MTATKKVFGKVNVKAAGVSFEGRQGKLCYLRKHEDDAYLTLRREKGNAADPNAIAVIAHVKGGTTCKVGYVPAKTARWLAAYMDAKQIVRCCRVKDEMGNPMPYVTGHAKTWKTSLVGCQFAIVYELPEKALAKAYAVNRS